MGRRTDHLTAILNDLDGSDGGAIREAVPLIYDELQALAGAIHAGERPGTLQPTVLVNEAFLRLSHSPPQRWNDRAHFFAVAARVMRHVLADHARQRLAAKRGGGWHRITLSGLAGGDDDATLDLEALDAALRELDALEPRHARIVELRYLAGLDTAATAAALGVSERTVKRDWRIARAWLHQRLMDPSA